MHLGCVAALRSGIPDPLFDTTWKSYNPKLGQPIASVQQTVDTDIVTSTLNTTRHNRKR